MFVELYIPICYFFKGIKNYLVGNVNYYFAHPVYVSIYFFLVYGIVIILCNNVNLLPF